MSYRLLNLHYIYYNNGGKNVKDADMCSTL